jgi:PadR family transcriptional regulator, regulatory protein PadR
MKLRLTPRTRQILRVLLHHSSEWKYGYEISLKTGVKSGTLYPMLKRLADKQLLETVWKSGEAWPAASPPFPFDARRFRSRP